MIQRRGKPSFSKDEERLLAYMDVTRHLTISYGAGYGYHSPQYVLSTSLTGAIDKIAEQLTGNPQFFWSSGHQQDPRHHTKMVRGQGRSGSCAGGSCGGNFRSNGWRVVRAAVGLQTNPSERSELRASDDLQNSAVPSSMSPLPPQAVY